MPYIAWEQQKNDTEFGRYVVYVDGSLTKDQKQLEIKRLFPLPDSDWQYVKSGKIFTPDKVTLC